MRRPRLGRNCARGAGTHNPKYPLLRRAMKKGTEHFLSHEVHGVWVPAFAATTSRDGALQLFADLSARETGLLLGRDEAAVRALQWHALAALRRHLDSPAPMPVAPRVSRLAVT